MTNSNMRFSVNENAVTSGIISMQLRNHKTDEKHFPAVAKFISKYENVCKKTHSDGTNIFDEMIPISTLPNMSAHTSMIKSRMKYEYDIEEEKLPIVDELIEDFCALPQAPEMQKVVASTVSYKNTIERLWRLSEASVLRHVKDILGYEPENIGKVQTYVMYPIVDTHRTYQVSEGKTSLFFGKAHERDKNKILAYLAHQAVHQPMLPYKPSMTKKEKEEYHAFIKFLADKETYTSLSGKSYLDITTYKENNDIMGKVYPYWLGYRYRNARKQGLDPAEEIRKAIARDYRYYKGLPEDEQRKFASYEFEKLSPEKIAEFFRDKKGYTPYQFAKIDFDNKDNVYKPKFVRRDDSR